VGIDEKPGGRGGWIPACARMTGGTVTDCFAALAMTGMVKGVRLAQAEGR